MDLSTFEKTLLNIFRFLTQNDGENSSYTGNGLLHSTEAMELYTQDLNPIAQKKKWLVGDTLWVCLLAAVFLSLSI